MGYKQCYGFSKIYVEMARRRVKKTVKEAAPEAGPSVDGNDPQIEEKQLPSIDQEGTTLVQDPFFCGEGDHFVCFKST